MWVGVRGGRAMLMLVVGLIDGGFMILEGDVLVWYVCGV